MFVERGDGSLGRHDLHDAPHSGGTCNGGNDTEQAERPAAGYQRHDAADSGHGNAVTTLVKRHIALLNQLRACGGYAGHARLNLVGRRVAAGALGSGARIASGGARAFSAGQVVVCFLEVLELLSRAILELLVAGEPVGMQDLHRFLVGGFHIFGRGIIVQS